MGVGHKQPNSMCTLSTSRGRFLRMRVHAVLSERTNPYHEPAWQDALVWYRYEGHKPHFNTIVYIFMLVNQ
eukprot:m.872434 g.872434  ORF g.872434 m.872434 type:complete len:71 (-) comp23571_c0_seq5:1224-1436(-)